MYALKFDGCSKGNPGPSGAGAVLYNDGVEIWANCSYVGKNTNNFAEYSGLILGLTEAVNKNIKDLIVYGDSLLVIQQMNKKYKVKSHNLIPLFNDAKELEKYFDSISYQHIYRNENSRADALSNDGLKLIN
jgi:ribonuclease HI